MTNVTIASLGVQCLINERECSGFDKWAGVVYFPTNEKNTTGRTCPVSITVDNFQLPMLHCAQHWHRRKRVMPASESHQVLQIDQAINRKYSSETKHIKSLTFWNCHRQLLQRAATIHIMLSHSFVSTVDRECVGLRVAGSKRINRPCPWWRKRSGLAGARQWQKHISEHRPEVRRVSTRITELNFDVIGAWKSIKIKIRTALRLFIFEKKTSENSAERTLRS